MELKTLKDLELRGRTTHYYGKKPKKRVYENQRKGRASIKHLRQEVKNWTTPENLKALMVEFSSHTGPWKIPIHDFKGKPEKWLMIEFGNWLFEKFFNLKEESK